MKDTGLDDVLNAIINELLDKGEIDVRVIDNLPIKEATKSRLFELNKGYHTGDIFQLNDRIQEMQEVLMNYAKLEFNREVASTGETDYVEALAITINIIGEELKASYDIISERDNTIQEESEKLKTANTKLKSSLEKQIFLTKELHHRVKNNLQFVGALMLLRIQETNDPRLFTILKEVQTQIINISKMHELMLESGNESSVDLKDYLTKISTAINEPSPQQGLIEVNGERVYVQPESATYLGIVINEMITNTIKHGWSKIKSKSKRKLFVSLFIDANNLNIHYSELNSEFQFDFTKTGMGAKLFDMIMFKQLRADHAICKEHSSCHVFSINQKLLSLPNSDRNQ